jgi:hypothetical protein
MCCNRLIIVCPLQLQRRLREILLLYGISLPIERTGRRHSSDGLSPQTRSKINGERIMGRGEHGEATTGGEAEIREASARERCREISLSR